MPVILGNASRPSFDAAGAMLQNKQIETQKAIALAQIKAANQRALLGAAEQAVGRLDQNARQDKAMAGQESRDARIRAENDRIRRQNQQVGIANRTTQLIEEELRRWQRALVEWEKSGVTHDAAQDTELKAIDAEFRRLHKVYLKHSKDENHLSADATLEEMLQVLRDKWTNTPTTKIPPKVEEVDGRKFIRGANGAPHWIDEPQEKIRKDNLDHAIRKRVQDREDEQESGKVFDRSYQSGSTYNDAVREMDEYLIKRGLEPSGKVMRRPEDRGYYYHDPKVDAAGAKQEKADAKWLAGEQHKVRKAIADRYLKLEHEEMPKEELDKAFKEEWDNGPYKAIAGQIQAERQSRSGQPAEAQQGEPASANAGIPQDVTEAEAWLKMADELVRNTPNLSAKQVNELIKNREAAKKTISDYRESQGLAPAAPARSAAPAQPVAPPPAVPDNQLGAAALGLQDWPATKEKGQPSTPRGPFKGKRLDATTDSQLSSPFAPVEPREQATEPLPSPFQPSPQEDVPQPKPQSQSSAPSAAAATSSSKPHVVVFTQDNCRACEVAKSELKAAKDLPFTYEIRHTSQTKETKDAYPTFEMKNQDGTTKPRTGFSTIKSLKNWVERESGQQETSSIGRGGNYWADERESGQQGSSLGGGGSGGILAMSPTDPIEGIARATWAAIRGEPNSSYPKFTGPDASSVSDGDRLDRLDGYRQRMEAWVQRNPMPSSSGLYQPIKDSNSRDFTNKPLYEGGALGPAKFPMTAAAFSKRQIAELAQQRQLDSEGSGGGGEPSSSAGPGLASPSWSNGPGAAGRALGPKEYQQALSELADWEKMNSGDDVSALRRAINEVQIAKGKSQIAKGKSQFDSGYIGSASQIADSEVRFGVHNIKQFDESLKEIDSWSKRNPGRNVDYVKQAIERLKSQAIDSIGRQKLPDVFGEIPSPAKGTRVPYDIAKMKEINKAIDDVDKALSRAYRGGDNPLSKERTKQLGSFSDRLNRDFHGNPPTIDESLANIAKSNGATKAEVDIAKSLTQSGTTPKTAIEAAKQLSRLDKAALKTLNGLGTLSRVLGHVGNVLTVAGWAGSIFQTPSKHIDPRVRDWAAQRMAAENGLADAFGIPRDDARNLSNSIDGYLDGIKPSHLKELRNKADRIVPPAKMPTSPSSSTPSKYKPSKQKVEMDVSPFAFVNERDLRETAVMEFSNRRDALPGSTEQTDEEKDLEEKTQEAIRSWSDFENYPWPKFKQELSDLAKDWAHPRGESRTQANDKLNEFAKEVDDLSDWNKPQPSWSRPVGVKPSEWKSIQSKIGSDGTESFFGAHIDKPGSYLRQGGEQRYDPGDLRQQSNFNQIQVGREPDGELKLTSGSGQEMYPMRSRLPQQLFPGARTGPRAFDQAHLEEMGPTPKEAAKQEAERNAVTVYGIEAKTSEIRRLLDSKDMPKNAEDSDQYGIDRAVLRTTGFMWAMEKLETDGWLAFDVKLKKTNFPDWVTKLPSAEWTGKDGKTHRENGTPKTFEGIKELVNRIEKDKEVGKHSPEWKAAKAAEKAADWKPRPLPPTDQIGIDHGFYLTPKFQEDALRHSKPATREEFEERLGMNHLDDKEYQNYIDSYHAVRNAPELQGGLRGTAPGNLFIDKKTGELMRNEGDKAKPVGPNEPLPRGYNQIVPTPPFKPIGQGQPQQQRQIGPADIARGHAIARDKQRAEDARNPIQQQLNEMDRQKLQDARGFGQPRPQQQPRIQRRTAPLPLDKQPFQLPPAGVPFGAGVRGQASYTPTPQDFSTQGQFRQSLNLGSRQSQPNYDNAFAGYSGMSQQYAPEQTDYALPMFYTFDQQPDYGTGYEQLDFNNRQQSNNFPEQIGYPNNYPYNLRGPDFPIEQGNYSNPQWDQPTNNQYFYYNHVPGYMYGVDSGYSDFTDIG